MRRRLAGHAVALGALLLLLLVLGGTSGVVSADEGAMLAQLDQLERTGSWTRPNPEPDADPDQLALPLELSERTDAGTWAPFAKHPAHLTLLRPAWAVGGLLGVLVVSMAGVVAAAVAAAVLAERMHSGSGVAVLWLTGVGSPLLFDGFQVVGHALGAAAFGWAVVAAVAAAESEQTRRLGPLAATGALVTAASLIRSEAVLAGLALGGVLGVGGLLRRRPWAIATGAAAVVAAVAVRLGEPRVVERLLGGGDVSTVSLGSSDAAGRGLLADRWSGFKVSVLDAGYGVDDGEGLLLLGVLLAAAAAMTWRWRRDAGLFRLLAIGAAAAGVGRMLVAGFLVPGLLPATPVLLVGLVLVAPTDARRWPAWVLWGTIAAFACGVVLTQYRTGGTGEWGGRYFAVALPAAVAATAVAAWRGVSGLDERTRRLGVACLVVLAGSLAVGAVRAADRARDASAAVADLVIVAVDGLDVDATVSTRGAVSRFAWEDVLDGRRWLTTDADGVGELVEALAADGADRLAVVTADVSTDLAALDGDEWEAGDPVEVRPGTSVVLLTLRSNVRSLE